MHPLIVLVAFAFFALTPFMQALPRGGDDGANAAEYAETIEVDDERDA